MRSLHPVTAAVAFLPFTDLLVAWVAVGAAIVGLSIVGCLAARFATEGARARLGV